MPTKKAWRNNRRRAGFSATNDEEARLHQTEPPNRLPASDGCLSQPSVALEFFTLTTRFAFDNGGDRPGYVNFRIGSSWFFVKLIARADALFRYNLNRLTNIPDWKVRSVTFACSGGVLTNNVTDSTGRSCNQHW